MEKIALINTSQGGTTTYEIDGMKQSVLFAGVSRIAVINIGTAQPYTLTGNTSSFSSKSPISMASTLLKIYVGKADVGSTLRILFNQSNNLYDILLSSGVGFYQVAINETWNTGDTLTIRARNVDSVQDIILMTMTLEVDYNF